MINRFFPPDEAPTAQLLGDLADHLARSGLKPTVIASRPRSSGPAAPAPGQHGPVVHRVWTSTLGLPGILGRFAEYATFAIGATRHLLAEVQEGDTVLVKTDPPLMSIVAGRIARHRGAEVINWCQDLFPEIASAIGMPLARGAGARTLLGLRTRAQARALVNVAISETMAARMRAEGIPSERIVVIPNWADGDMIRPVEHHANRWRQDLGLGDQFVVGYSGNLGRVHDPQPIFALIRRMAGRSDTTFVVIGGGTGNVALRRMVERAGLSNVRFLPYQPRACLAETLSAIDLHLVSLRPACEGLSFPSKLYGILAAGRPALFIGDPNGEAARLLTSGGAGLAVDGRDPAAMEDLVLRLRAEAGTRGRAARRLFEDRFRKDLALASWLGCLGVRQRLVSIAGADASFGLVPLGGPDFELAEGTQTSGGRPAA